MAKDKHARRLNEMTMALCAVVVGAIVDTMRAADLSNDLAHYFLDKVEEGSDALLYGSTHSFSAVMVSSLRRSVPGND